MKLKLFYAAIGIIILPYLIGCGSGSYNIKKGDYKIDSTQYKSTGAKLKNFYKVQTSPLFTLMISGGMNVGVSELSSNYQNSFDAQQFTEGLNFGVKNGFGISATGKWSLHHKGNLRLNVSGAFSRFSSAFLVKESPFGNVSYNVFTTGAGLENCFSPSFRLKPFIGAELTGNIIMGTADIKNSNNTTRIVKFKPSFRIGYMLYGGFEYMFKSNKFGVNLVAKLTSANLLLKSSNKSDNPDEVPIRDKKVDGSETIEFAGFKNFIYTSFLVGVNFYFGVKDIVYRFNK